MEMRGQLYASVASSPEKATPVPIAQEARWAPGRFGGEI
jgi:hypothetical protein